MNKDLSISDDGGWIVDPATLPPRRAGSVIGAPSDEAGGLDFIAILRVLIARRWMVLGAALSGVILAIIVTMMTTKLYRAGGTLEVNPPMVRVTTDKNQDDQASTATFDFVFTQVGLMSSRSIAERTAQDLNLANNPEFGGTSGTPAERLKRATDVVTGGIKVIPPESGSLIRYTYTSTSPVMAAAVANQIATSFINSGLQRRYDASSYARAFLSNQINKTRGDLERSERQLVAYAQQQGIINTSSGPNGGGGDTNSLQGESLVSLNKALADATARRVAAEGAYRQGVAVGATTEVNLATSGMRQTLATLEADYQDKRTLLKPDHPDMVALQSRIDEVRRSLARESSQASSGRANSLRADYRGALATEQSLRGQVSGLKGSVLNLRGRSILYNIYQREVDTNRSLYDALLQRYKEVGVSAGIGTSPVSIVDRATIPTGPFKPNMLLNVIYGLLFGLVAGIGVALALDFFSDTIKSRDDVRNKLGLACLGVIPKGKAKTRFLDDLRDPRSLVSEAYSSVVASLRFSTEEGTPNLLMVTSSRSHEGKSSSALALAQNLARNGRKVLLIDCDLRKPVFRAATDAIGMTRLLTDDRAQVADHVVRTQFDDLFLLPAGPIPPNPSDLLSTSRFQQVIDEAGTLFDTVLVDCPPVMGLADALLMASSVNHVAFIVESGRTHTRLAQEAIGLLRRSGAHMVGGILTKAADDGGSYGYNYGYGYGHDREKLSDRSSREILMVADDSDAGS